MSLRFPPVGGLGATFSDAQARELAASLSTLFVDVDPLVALSFLLVGTLRLASKRLPRNVLDGIYAYETDQVYGPRERVRLTTPRPPPRRPRRG